MMDVGPFGLTLQLIDEFSWRLRFVGIKKPENWPFRGSDLINSAGYDSADDKTRSNTNAK
jgi:hypothetical protein